MATYDYTDYNNPNPQATKAPTSASPDADKQTNTAYAAPKSRARDYTSSLITAKNHLDSVMSEKFNAFYSDAFRSFLGSLEQDKKDRLQSIKNSILQDSRYNNSSKLLSSLVQNSQNIKTQISSKLQTLKNEFESKKQAQINDLLKRIKDYKRSVLDYESTHNVPKPYSEVEAEIEANKKARRERELKEGGNYYG